mgnify:CR=1 FL=1
MLWYLVLVAFAVDSGFVCVEFADFVYGTFVLLCMRLRLSLLMRCLIG